MQTTSTVASITAPSITWEPLPDDYVIPEDPVDNLTQPLLAAVLREILELAGLVKPSMLIATNFGLCATVEDRTVVKAADWTYAPEVNPLPAGQTRRSYTPYLQGGPVAVVMEFISDTEGSEYSVNPYYPYGKWWFYERILQVPSYFIFWPESGRLEGYQLSDGRYEPQDIVERDRAIADESVRYWVDSLGLFLGVWQGEKADRSGYWLRWWDADGKLLPWASERVAQAEQRAQEDRERAERLAQRLRSLGVDPDGI